MKPEAEAVRMASGRRKGRGMERRSLLGLVGSVTFWEVVVDGEMDASFGSAMMCSGGMVLLLSRHCFHCNMQVGRLKCSEVAF